MAELKIKADSGGGTVSLKGPATTTSNAAVQLTLPVDDGAADQYLKTDGSGALSWATVSSPITALNNATANELVTVGSTTTELDAEAGLTFDGTHLSITDGDLKVATAGHGIDFSATSDGNGTDSSELLDDYEEGTFTPVLTVGGSTTGTVMGVQAGAYTKIGRMVHVTVGASFTDKGSGSGSIAITGLPYSVGDTLSGTNNDAGGFAWYQGGMNSLTVDGSLTTRFVGTTIEFNYLNSDNNSVLLQYADISDSSSWRLHGVYYI